MKNILFYYDNFCGESSRGGTEVATYRIAKALQETGEVEIFHAFRSGAGDKDSRYKDTLKLSHKGSNFEKSLSEFIDKNDIGTLVNMSRFFRHKHICGAAQKSKKNPKVIFMQHFAPGSEMKKATYKSGFHLLKLNPFNPLYWIRATIYPLLKLQRKMSYGKAYKSVYDSSDAVVLLSEGYSEDYQKIAGIEGNAKFKFIPNIFDSPLRSGIQDFQPAEGSFHNETGSSGKEKRVLILSRMDEVQKRMSLALRIWKNIEKDPDLNDWHLDIVGSGHDTGIVKRLISKLGLKNVTYHGWQSAASFLKRSSILMMTSEYEGLPLSILEAQAYGCVPIAYNSFASLKDVITPFENGVVAENFGNIEEFTNLLKDLMYDESYRKELSEKGMRTQSKFSSDNIAKEWLRILT